VYYYAHEEVYAMRTNIIIDDALMEKAFDVSGLKTKKEIVEQAMREFVERRVRKDLSDLKGKINFADGYDYKALRNGDAQ
jgi:Arc/MetJ family transcription regulator